MSSLTQRILYHALMEGMTNGIRHGRCQSFQFSLRHQDGMLTFRLANDGEAYGSARPGFGLSTMMERVHLLGGAVSITSNTNPDSGKDEGCVLTITLPLQAA